MSSFPRMPQPIKQVFQDFCSHIPGAIIAGGAIRDTLNDKRVKDIDIFVSYAQAHMMTGKITHWSRLGKGRSKLFDYDGDPIGYTPRSARSASTNRLTYQFSNTSHGQNVHLGSIQGTISKTAANMSINALKEESTNDYENNRKIVEVYERHCPNTGYLLNLIFTECDPVEYVNRYFDFGICKAWYDGTFVNMSGEYTTDVNNKTITMTLPDEHVIACYGSLQAGVDAMRDHGDRIQQKYRDFKIVMPYCP